MKPSRSLVVLALLTCAAVALALQPRDLGSWMGDEAHYIFLAQSLAGGQGYRTINEPGAPPHTHYPPLFPLLLAPIVAVAGFDFWRMHLLAAACGIVGLIWWSRYLREMGLPDRTVALVVFVLGTSPLWCLSIGRILSDIPYTSWVCGTLWVAHRCARSPSAWNRWLWLSIAGALALCLTRTIGVAAAVAIACAWCDPRGVNRSAYRGRQSLCLLGSVMLAVGLWWLRNHLVAPGHPSYLNQLILANPLDPDVGRVTWDIGIRRVVGNAWFYGLGVADLFWSHKQPVAIPVRFLASVACGAAIAIGGWRRFARRRGVPEWYLVWHLVVLLVWPWYFDRFLLPLAPILALYLVEGVGAIAEGVSLWRGGRAAGQLLPAIWVSLLVLINMPWAMHLVRLHRQGYPSDPTEREFRAVHAWLKEHSASEAVIMSCRSPITTLWTERKAVNYPYTTDAERVMEAIDRDGVDYVIIDNFSPATRRCLVPAVQQFIERFDPQVVTIGQQAVLQVRPRSDGR